MASRITVTPQDCIADFTALGGMRVWSVLITIFGDAVAPRGGVVPAVVLQAILECLHIKPEAMRVALHRLVKDGWITRQKSGRQSFYALSAQGQTEFLSATQRIYAPAPLLQPPWHMAVLPPQPDALRRSNDAALRNAGYIAMTPTAYLGHDGVNTPCKDAIIIGAEMRQFPDWARDALAPAPLPDEYARLEQALIKVQKTTPQDAISATALRVLMIHQWRRILLRHADLPQSLLPKDWRGEAVRHLILEQHSRLSQNADPWLDANIAPRTAPD